VKSTLIKDTKATVIDKTVEDFTEDCIVVNNKTDCTDLQA
jgi:hypothetical protein